MSARSENFEGWLKFDPSRGEIRLKSYRMVLSSASALGALRRELIETLGMDRARGLMKRFGHAAGLADGVALKELFPDSSIVDHMSYGPALHGLEGVARVVPIPEASAIDPENGRLHLEAYWEGSYEAEQHLELFGPSREPVCWTLVGYATGHSTSAAGARTIAIETECRAMGHPRCRMVVDYEKNLSEAVRREACDYEKQHLSEVLQNLLDKIQETTRSLRSREKEISTLESELAQYRPPANFVGESPIFKTALTTAKTVAPVDAGVLILGESGTGKELLARFIHDHSLRRDKPFIAVNCSALPETLQEAELFGYAKGAFTGASTATAGLFEAAHEGTLFLDEVGDLSLTAQTKILRALQDGEIKRLGETKTRKTDVRVIAATNRDLKAMIADRSFREDVYYRLSVVGITMPPLRDRGNDALLVAEHFLDHFAARFRRPLRPLSREARGAIASHRWPGNVRELQHVIERAVIVATGSEIEVDDLPPEILSETGRARKTRRISPDNSPTLDRARFLAITNERSRLETALAAVSHNRERAADLLGLSRTTLWRRMKKLGIAANERAGER